MRWMLLLLVWAVPALAGPALPLEGTKNTRDMGGLAVREGVVRPGMVYRSGALCFVTDRDVAVLEGLQIRTLLELRSDAEIARDGPDRLALTDSIPVVLRMPMVNSRGNGAAAYAGYVEENPRVIRDFFALLAEQESYPLLFHCSAGKDRTGILAALLLMALGSPREVVMADYMESVRISPKLVVHPEWLQVVFDAVDREGGIEAFLSQRGVTNLEAVRRNLVAPRS